MMGGDEIFRRPATHQEHDMTLSLLNLTFDCADADALSSFWSAALGRAVDDGASTGFAAIGYPSEPGRPAWLFIQVPEGKSAKNRFHLDLGSEDRDAEVADHEQDCTRWTVMTDPEGNEFCVA